jgi:adenylate cyclase
LFHSRKVQLALICSACTALVLVAELCGKLGYGFSPLVRWELRFRNVLTIEGRKSPPDPRLIFLAIDNESVSIEKIDLDSLFARVPHESADYRALTLMAGQWPWPREVYGLALDKLFAAGASVVVFDLLFPKPSGNDAPFRAALDRHRDRVVVGSNFVALTDTHAANAWEHTVPADELIPQTTPLDQRVAYTNFFADEVDETIRRARFRLRTGPGASDEIILSLAARAVTQAGLGHLVPPPAQSERLFRYAAPPGFGFRPVSIYQLFVPKYWQANFGNGERLRGKIVVIGPSGNWQHDEHETPFGKMPGPELHLNAINALLHQAFLFETPLWVDALLVLLAGFVAWLVSLFTARPALQIVRGLVATGAVVVLAFGAYNYLSVCSAVIAPLLALNLSGGSCFVYEYIREQLDKARTRRTLERYVSKDVVRELLDNRESVLHSLVGARKAITVLFSDLRGFTTLTESADAASLVEQLNEYFNRMVRIVFANSGTLDKFIGDGLMAHWGSIVSKGEVADACAAVRTALEMRAALARLNEEWQPRDRIKLDFGIGINSGEAIVGNLGCDEKMEVSVIGDPVNLAARIEGATKEYRTDLLIGEQVAQLVRNAFVLRSVDLLLVKGKTKPVEVFTVLEERHADTQEPEWLRAYETGTRLYRQREFAEAARHFREAAALKPGDWLAEEYLRRAESYVATPPAPDWDGVYVMTRK